MAIKVGKKSEEGAFKLYKGVGAVSILAVNPNKKQLEELLGRELENEPEYLTKTEEGKTQMRVCFYAKTEPTANVNNGIEVIVPINFNLVADARVGQTTGKIQVLDKYGRFAWANEEEVASGAIPMYKSKETGELFPANISAGYRKACQGEEPLVEFLKAWLNIPNPANYKEGKWIMKTGEALAESEVDLNLKEIFAGNVSSLAELVPLASDYLVKCAFGVRTTDEGKQYQAVYTRAFAKNGVTDYSKLDKHIAESQGSGVAPNTVFSVEKLHEDKVEATEYSNSEVPFPAPAGGTAKSPWG